MPREQEQLCATAVSDYLTERTGRPWREEQWNDDYQHGAPSFDVRLSDGREDLLVEITCLTDGRRFSEHEVREESLYRRLAPYPDKSYVLYPPSPYEVHLDRRDVKRLRRRIKSAARGLGVGGKVPVAFPKRGTLKFKREAKPGFITCNHDDRWPLSEFSSETSGVYFLFDGGYEHQFLTAECRAEFLRRLARACPQSREQGRIEVEWEEEWELQRREDPADGKGGVEVPGFVADIVESAAIQSVRKGLEHGRKKRQQGRDGAQAAVALHAGERQHRLSLMEYEDAITKLSASDVWPLDAVFLVDGDRVRQCINYDHPNAPT